MHTCETCGREIASPSGCNVRAGGKTYWVHSGDCRKSFTRRWARGRRHHWRDLGVEAAQNMRDKRPDPWRRQEEPEDE